MMNGNPLQMILQMKNGGMSPQNILNQMMQQNPQASQMITQLQNQANGRSPREMALQSAKQVGMSDQDFNQLIGMLGLK